MTLRSTSASLLLGIILIILTTTAYAQGPPNGFGNGGGSNNNGGTGSSPPSTLPYPASVINKYEARIIAHAVTGTLAFAFFFPVGSIMIRLCSFPGLWWVHGVFQMFAFLLYSACFGIGIHMAPHLNAWRTAHVIVGLVLWAVLVLMPILGWLHHVAFVRTGRRGFWSYAHVWTGRVVVTVGIVNGGLGLQLGATKVLGRPSQGAVIGYAVAAGVMWFAYVAAAFTGESRRSRQLRQYRTTRYEPKRSQESVEPGQTIVVHPNKVGLA